FPTLITLPTPSSSPSRITSSPLLSSEPSTEPTFEPQPSPDAEYHVPSSNELPLHVIHSHGSDEGSLKLIELMNLVTKLSKRIRVLEDDLKRAKQTYSAAFTKLILRIKKLESKVKTRESKEESKVTASELIVLRGRCCIWQKSKRGKERDKGKEIMTEPAPVKSPRKKEAHVARDEEIAKTALSIGLKKKKEIEKDTSKRLPGKEESSSLEQHHEVTTKQQKVELNDEKEDLKGYLDIVPREDVVVNVDSLSIKYPIVDWKTYTLSENFMYYKIIRGEMELKELQDLSHYARECQKPKVCDAKYFREQMLLATKDEVRSNLSNEENDCMLDTSYGEDLEELTAVVMLMAQLQLVDDNAKIVPS
ncbi:hypothetical protein Tco_0931078, partial [Tanacetum coccineum]